MLAVHAFAGDHPSELSPDNRYRVIIKDDPDQELSYAAICDRKTGKMLSTDALTYYQGGGVDVQWRKDSHVVALGFEPGKTRYETLLYWIDNGKIFKVQLPDFMLNILGRQGGITAKFKNGSVTFDKFLDGNRCLLSAHVEVETHGNETARRPDDEFRPTNFTNWDVEIQVNGPSDNALLDVRPSEDQDQ